MARLRVRTPWVSKSAHTHLNRNMRRPEYASKGTPKCRHFFFELSPTLSENAKSQLERLASELLGYSQVTAIGAEPRFAS
jgi:hypothetical protein